MKSHAASLSVHWCTVVEASLSLVDIVLLLIGELPVPQTIPVPRKLRRVCLHHEVFRKLSVRLIAAVMNAIC